MLGTDKHLVPVYKVYERLKIYGGEKITCEVLKYSYKSRHKVYPPTFSKALLLFK